MFSCSVICLPSTVFVVHHQLMLCWLKTFLQRNGIYAEGFRDEKLTSQERPLVITHNLDSGLFKSAKSHGVKLRTPFTQRQRGPTSPHCGPPTNSLLYLSESLRSPRSSFPPKAARHVKLLVRPYGCNDQAERLLRRRAGKARKLDSRRRQHWAKHCAYLVSKF